MPGESSTAARRSRGAVGPALVLALAMVAARACPAASESIAMTPGELERFDRAKHSLQLSDGVTLAYLDVGKRDGTPLVLIHGYTDSARDWAPIEPLLADKFRLIIVDLRGHGVSSKPDCCYTRFDFAEDIKLLLDQLHLASADLAGHSLGSVVAQTFAELWPSAARRLVLISSTGTSFGDISASKESSDSALPGWLRDLDRLHDPIDANSKFMEDWWHVSMSVNPEFFWRKQHRDAAAMPARVWRAIADQSLMEADLQWMLPRIKARTLLIWGGRDALASPAGRDALRLGIAHAEVRTFSSLGHDLLWENPAAVAAVISDFLVKP
jgi:pimeloyl-ACP methyl ester carboxylesterase